MTGDLDPLAAVRADAARLDALAARTPSDDDDPAFLLLAALRGEIDDAVASTTSPALRRDAGLLDALAAGVVIPSSADPAVALLHSLRAAVDGVTVPAPVALPAAALVAVADSAPGERTGRRRRRVLRTGVAAGSVALALSMSGVAAAAFGSHPGGTLYGLRAQTFGRTDDDPVAAEQVLSQLTKQVAVAASSPDDAAAVAKARAYAAQLQKDLAAENRDPVVQQSIAASAVTVVRTVEALPAPVIVSSRTPRPAGSTGSTVAGRSGTAVRSAGPTDSPSTQSGPPVAPLPLEPSPGVHTPEASPGALVTPSPSGSTDPTGTPTAGESSSGTPSPSASGSSTSGASAEPSSTPTATPSESAGSSATATPSDAPSATTSVRATPVRTFAAVKTTKPKARTVKKKKVTATLMTAQLPSSGLPQR